MSAALGRTSARAALATRGYALGSWVVSIGSPAAIWVLARSGLDFLYLDMEHSSFSVETVGRQLAAARAAGVTAIVRPPSKDFPVGRLLDLGALGVLIPDVECGADVERAVAAARYAPGGSRGVSTSGPHTDYAPIDPGYLAWANQEVIVAVQLETAAAFDRIDEILAVPGLDVAVVGRNDLSHDLGVPGRVDGPEVTKYVELLLERCAAHGVTPGLLVGGAPAALEWLGKGVRWLPIGSEASLLGAAASAAVSAVHAAAAAALGKEGTR
jgi:2-keto-3-deoxy-L-rhamnonate aldolase RhmA